MLSGEKLVKNAKKAVMMYPELFDSLAEYDRTHKLRKINYKERANFTIDSNLLNKFRAYCNKNGMKMSAKIEKYMEEELGKNEYI